MKVLKGYKSKTGLHHTIDIDVALAFDEITKEKCFNKSQLIEKMIKEWVEENK